MEQLNLRKEMPYADGGISMIIPQTRISTRIYAL